MKSYHHYNEKICTQQCQFRLKTCHFLRVLLTILVNCDIVRIYISKGDLL